MKTITEAIKAKQPDEKNRVYAVTIGGQTQYVVTNSKGNAALQVCTVRTLSQREVADALVADVCGR